MDSSKLLIAVALTALVTGVGGFFAGMQYQKSKGLSMGDFQSMREQFRSGDRPSEFEGRLQGQGRPISGEIIDQDEESITVKLLDGSSRIAFVGEETKISESTPSAKDKLTAGIQVFVTGTENPDGSMNATSIQIGD